MPKKSRTLRILAISGSLRAVSSNTALLCAAATLAPSGVEISVYRGLGDLPLFNPDIEDVAPPSVLDFRARLQASDGVLIASPEYAHGVTGVLKNALDWVVGGEEFVNKPVAILNASPRATHAYAALTEIITVMSARIVGEASLTIPLAGNEIDQHDIVSNPDISSMLHAAVVEFASAIEQQQVATPFNSTTSVHGLAVQISGYLSGWFTRH